MPLSRRSFVKAASAGGIGALSIPLIAARGSEALREFGGLELASRPGSGFASDERKRFRLLNRVGNPIQLDSNENPNGPGKAALEAMTKAFDQTMRYPDVYGTLVQEAVAKKFAIQPNQVLMSCGSGEVLRVASYAFTGPDRALVTGSPSFEDPVRHSEMMKAEIRAVPVDGHLKLDLARMLDQVNPAGKAAAGLVFLCNPNNPTATVHGKAAISEFIAEVNRRAPNCVVMLDEAYHEYVEDPTYETGINHALNNPRVIVVRTFSKVFGMAGMRLGYAIGHSETLRHMRPHLLPNAINVLAAAAGIATIADTKHIDHERMLNKAARDFTRKSFESLGYKATESHGNFLMIAINRDVRGFRDACAKQGVFVGRPFPPLLTHARISIGTMDEMKKATEVFRQVLTAAAN
jgi:histidinol-phosphate aminotransferase